MCSFGSSNASAPTTQFSTQTTNASPQAQLMYNQAWQNAQQTAQRPFTPYSYDPNAFVAPMNQTQLQAIGNIAGYQGASDPFYKMGAAMTGNAGNTTAPQVLNQYMNPYMSQVVDPTRAAVEQQQAFQRQNTSADQIKAGAFGQERGQLMQAVLAGQQNLGMGQALSPLYQDAYKTGLGAAQTDLQRQLQAGQTMGQLGQGYTQTGLGAAQALLGAGTIGQQTQQAGLQALYNQFMMQQMYPFQTSQFLASTAAGLGPGYGGTTSGYQSSMQPLSYMGNPLSDPHLKVGAEGDEPEVIGSTNDGQDIYRYRVINPDTGELGPVQIGLMADEVQERRPDAIGDYKGYRTVDYEKATDGAARLGGGVKSAGGDYAYGGGIDDIVNGQREMYAGLAQIGSRGIVPQSQMGHAQLNAPTLTFAQPKQEQKQDFLKSLGSTADTLLSLYKTGKEAKDVYSTWNDKPAPPKALGGSMYGDDEERSYVPNNSPMPTAHLDTPTLEYQKPEREKKEDGLGDILGTIGTIVSLGSKIAPMLSDRRLKTGVRPGRAEGGGIFDDIANALAGHGYADGSSWERAAGEPMDIRPAIHHAAGVMPRHVEHHAPVARHVEPRTRGYDIASPPPAKGLDVGRFMARYSAPSRDEIRFNTDSPGLGVAALPSSHFTPFPHREERFNYGSPGLGVASLPSSHFTPFPHMDRHEEVAFHAPHYGLGAEPLPARFTDYDKDPGVEHLSPYEAARSMEAYEDNRPLGTGIAGFARGGYATKGSTPYSDEDLDYLTRTLIKEAAGEGDRGMEAVGDVARNRFLSGKYGKSIKDVVTARKQFTPWNDEMRGTKADPRLIDASSDIYQKGLGISRRVLDGAEDLTGGAMNFFNPKLAQPKWAAGKEGLDIGNHRFLDASGAPGAGVVPMAYAGKEGRPSSPGIDAIETGTIGKGVVPKAAAAAANDDSTPARGLTGFFRGAPAKDIGEKAGDFLTSERFIVPLLAGLGGMAKSQSRFLAPAILQGLGEGAQAYMQVPKTEAETALVNAEAQNKNTLNKKFEAEGRGVEIDNFMKSFMKTPYGNVVFLADGTPLLQSEYTKMARDGKPPQLLGSIPQNAAELVQKGIAKASGVADTGEEKQPGVKIPAEEPAAPVSPGGVYDQKSSEKARREQKLALDGGLGAEAAAKATKDYGDYVNSSATEARESAPYLKELSTTLADAYAQNGWDVPGFQADMRSELSNLVNTLYRAAGGTEDLSSIQSGKEKMHKIAQFLSERRSSAAGQHAFAALSAIKSSVPNLEMSPEAGAELSAQLMALNQKSLDRDVHFRRYMDESKGFARDAGSDFEDPKRSARYQKEQAILKHMMLHRPGALKILMSGAGATPEQIEAKIKQWYGRKAPSDMWRYFSPAS